MTKHNLSELDTEYMLMKKSLYRKFFVDFFRMGSIIPILEIGRSIYLGEPEIFYSTLKTVAFAGVTILLIIKSEKYQEKFMTISLCIFYAILILARTWGDAVFMTSPEEAFDFAGASTAYAAAIGNRIPKFGHRAFYQVFLVITRLIAVPPEEKSVLFVDFTVLAFGLYLDYDRERHDQNLFDSAFCSKDQLQRFKDLVVSDIPDGIAIVSKEMNQCLFANNSFNKLFEGSYDRSIDTCLSKFFIEESLSETTMFSDQSARSPIEKQTLLRFIHNHLNQEENRTIFTRTSCNVSLRSSVDGMDHHNSFEQIQNPHEYSFDVKIIPLIWDQKPAIGIILHDVTQQNTIIRLKVAANIQKDRILATVSHELRTPLNSMLGMIQVMEQKTKDKELLQYMDICRNSGYLLLGIVNSILDMNMIKANKLKLNIEKICLKEFLQDIMRLFQFQCVQKKIELKFNVSPMIPRMITTDKNRLGQIFINLIGNSLKFTQNGGIKVIVEPCIQHKDYILISVEDTGIGIKKEDRNKLFRVFGKLDYKDTVVNSQGVGLGLTISNNLAKLLCGNKDLAGIQVQTEYKKGSRFSFLIDKELSWDVSPSFPNKKKKTRLQEEDVLNTSSDFPIISLDEGEVNFPQFGEYSSPSSPVKKKLNFKVNWSSSTPSSPRKQLIDRSMPLQKMSNLKRDLNILVVDDNPLNLTVAELFLKTHHYNAKGALSGQQAIEFLLGNDFERNPIQLILMDLQMPIMDGYQATKELRDLMKNRKIPEIPIVALTANTSEKDKKTCVGVGMVDHISKPLKEEELKRVLKKYE